MSLLQSDVVIIGNELSGLAAGALLAHEGLKVAWLGPDPNQSMPLSDFMAPKHIDLWQLNTQQADQDLFRDLLAGVIQISCVRSNQAINI